MQIWFDIKKIISINTILPEKCREVISLIHGCRKIIWQYLTCTDDQNYGTEGSFLHMVKGTYQNIQLTPDLILKTKCFSSKTWKRQQWSFLPLSSLSLSFSLSLFFFFFYWFHVPASVIKQEKEIKGINTGNNK